MKTIWKNYPVYDILKLWLIVLICTTMTKLKLVRGYTPVLFLTHFLFSFLVPSIKIVIWQLQIRRFCANCWKSHRVFFVVFELSPRWIINLYKKTLSHVGLYTIYNCKVVGSNLISTKWRNGDWFKSMIVLIFPLKYGPIEKHKSKIMKIILSLLYYLESYS